SHLSIRSEDDDRQEAVAEPEGEKGMGATIAIRRPRSGDRPSTRSGDRRGQWRALRCRTAGSRSGTGTPLRVFHGGPAPSGGLVTELQSEDSGDAVDWSVLDSHLRDTRRAWLPSVSWSMPDTPRTCQDARVMCRKASGY